MSNFCNILIGSSVLRISKNKENRHKLIGMLITNTQVKYIDSYILDIAKFITALIDVEPDNSCDLTFYYSNNTSKKNKKKINSLCQKNMNNITTYWREVLTYV
jgi:hypothetical protein